MRQASKAAAAKPYLNGVAVKSGARCVIFNIIDQVTMFVEITIENDGNDGVSGNNGGSYTPYQ